MEFRLFRNREKMVTCGTMETLDDAKGVRVVFLQHRRAADFGRNYHGKQRDPPAKETLAPLAPGLLWVLLTKEHY